MKLKNLFNIRKRKENENKAMDDTLDLAKKGKDKEKIKSVSKLLKDYSENKDALRVGDILTILLILCVSVFGNAALDLSLTQHTFFKVITDIFLGLSGASLLLILPVDIKIRKEQKQIRKKIFEIKKMLENSQEVVNDISMEQVNDDIEEVEKSSEKGNVIPFSYAYGKHKDSSSEKDNIVTLDDARRKIR